MRTDERRCISACLAYFGYVLSCTTQVSANECITLDTPQYGSGKTLGARKDGRTPTYVYPSALKALVRARFSDVVKDWQDPVGPQVPVPYNICTCTCIIQFFYNCRFTTSRMVTWPRPSGQLRRSKSRLYFFITCTSRHTAVPFVLSPDYIYLLSELCSLDAQHQQCLHITSHITIIICKYRLDKSLWQRQALPRYCYVLSEVRFLFNGHSQ